MCSFKIGKINSYYIEVNIYMIKVKENQGNDYHKSQGYTIIMSTKKNFFSFIIHMCIQGLGHFSPRPHPLP
jgi:hypothetical protein